MMLRVVGEFRPQSREERIAVLSPTRRAPRRARCDRCQRAYFWPAGRLRMEDAWCPECGGRMWQAAWYLASMPWFRCDVAADLSIQEGG